MEPKDTEILNDKKPPTVESDKPSSRKGKKRSTVSKLVEKRRNSESGSEFGSTFSLKSSTNKPNDVESASNLSAGQGNANNSSEEKDQKLESAKKSPPIPSPRSVKNVSSEGIPLPMDIDSESDEEPANNDGDIISKKAPSDATIHRFRALKVANNEISEATDLTKSPFVPKPPTTPRKDNLKKSPEQKKASHSQTTIPKKDSQTTIPKKDSQTTIPKKDSQTANSKKDSQKVTGEKRTRDPYSSGEETATEHKAKKQSSSTKIVMSEKSKDKNVKGVASKVPPSTVKSDSKDKVAVTDSKTIINTTVDSEAELKKELNSKYEDVLMRDNACVDSAFSTPKSGRLSPISPRGQPPPLQGDISSGVLRTTYKADPKYTLNKFFSVPGPTTTSPIGQRPPDLLSQMSSNSVLLPISIHEARARYVTWLTFVMNIITIESV